MYKDKNKKAKEYVSFNSEKIDGEELGVWSYSDDRTINGGKFFNNIKGSNNKNETNSKPLERLIGSCSL